MKKIASILIILIIFSCSTTRSIEKTSSEKLEKKETISKQKDSIYDKESKVSKLKDSSFIEIKETYIPPTKIKTSIDNPCDSLGNLKKGSFSLTSGKTKLNIIINEDNIDIESFTDSLSSVYKREYRSRKESDSITISKYLERYKNDSTALVLKEKTLISKYKSVTKFRYPWWLIVFSLASLALNVFLIKKFGFKKVLELLKKIFT